MSTDEKTVLGLTYPQILKKMGNAEVAEKLKSLLENEVDQKFELHDTVERLQEHLEELEGQNSYLDILFPLLSVHADFIRGIRTLGELVEAGRKAQRLYLKRVGDNSVTHYLL